MNTAKQKRIKALLELGPEILKLDIMSAGRLVPLLADALKAAEAEDESTAILGESIALEAAALASEQTQLAILAELQKQTALLVTLCRHQDDAVARQDKQDRALGVWPPISRSAEPMPDKPRKAIGKWNPVTCRHDPLPEEAGPADS